jgi:signal transduction histidine kinase
VSPGLRAVLQGILVAAGVAATIAGALALRLDDWPIYVAFTLLSFVLFVPSVEVLPSLTLPLPGLALCTGFLYIGGLPIVFVRNVAPPFLWQLARLILPERFTGRLPELPLWGGGRFFSLRGVNLMDRGAVGADWAAFSIGLTIRWLVAERLASGAPPVSRPVAILGGEVAGYLFWGLLSLVPILSFRPIYAWQAPGGLRPVFRDLGLIMILALTPFVFLIAYGYATHGLVGAVVWSLAALGLHFMLQRLTDRRLVVEEQNRRLEALNRELQHRERLSAIGKMSSVISHQMLQQLGVIGLHADLIRHADGGEDPAAAVAQAKENAGAIEDALGGVNRVLTDLLVFSRDLRLNVYEHRACPLLAECVDAVRAAAGARGVTLRLECAADPTAVLDKLKVKQVVVNLLQNAIEASPAGSEVVVRATARDGQLEIAVSDHGPGVRAEDREAVFTPFFTRKEHGTGLGLAIAREFTEAHGGRIAVEDAEGGGARFVLRLPLAGPPG